MNSKIFNLLLCGAGIISAIDVIVPVLSYFDIFPLSIFSSPFFLDKILPVIKIAIVIFLFSVVIRYKRNFANLFSLLNEMAVNNKLHPIRERVMIEYDLLKRSPVFHVRKAKFNYCISCSSKGKGKKTDFFDITYDLDFTLRKSVKHIFTRNLTFSFYVIGYGSTQKTKSNPYYLQNCNAKVYINGVATGVSPIIHPATISGESNDRAPNYAGLYRVEFPFTEHICVFDTVRIKFRYVVYDNINLQKDNYLGQYGFAIIPLNYSQSVSKWEINVSHKKDVILENLELQEISYDGKISMRSLFTKTQEESFCLLDPQMKPNVKSSYFIAFDYGKK